MQHEPGHHHDFQDIEKFVRKFDAPERDTWQKPEQVIASLQLSPNVTVAELGAGTGYFAVRIARQIPQGKVIALDAQSEMVAYLNKRAAELGLTNLSAHVVHCAEPITFAEPLDVLLCVDTYHHIENRSALFSAYASQLKAAGTIVIIDRGAESQEGPPSEFRLTREQVIEEMVEAGLTLVSDLDFLQPIQFYLAFIRDQTDHR